MFQCILVPLDGSESSDAVIDAAVGLARQLRASLTGFLPAPSRPRCRGLPVLEDLEDDDGQSLARADAMLLRLEAAAQAAGVVCRPLRAQPAGSDKALLAAAESCGCDLMLLLTAGRGVFGEPLFGSQNKAVLAGSRLPLLMLPVQR